MLLSAIGAVPVLALVVLAQLDSQVVGPVEDAGSGSGGADDPRWELFVKKLNAWFESLKVAPKIEEAGSGSSGLDLTFVDDEDMSKVQDSGSGYQDLGSGYHQDYGSGYQDNGSFQDFLKQLAAWFKN